MASLHKLNDKQIRALNKVGYHSDGGNLYVRVKASGARSFSFRWTIAGRTNDLGIGGYPAISLKAARKISAEYRDMLAAGENPKSAKRRLYQPTFAECAEQYLAMRDREWTNDKHRQQWRNTLKNDASALSNLRVSDIELEHVLRVLQPIWQTKPETASRLRGRIENVLAFAQTKKWRTISNPAGWKGNLENVLPKPAKLSQGHHAALPYSDMPQFWSELERINAVSAYALRVLILTASRAGEVVGAQWSEIDIEACLWTMPAERMKARKEHQVPLSGSCLAILHQMQMVRSSNFVFPGQGNAKPISQASISKTLKRIRPEITLHGFRSTFRDWAGDKTNAPREIAEGCLPHNIGNAVEQAYRRGSALDKRRQLLDQWETYCLNKSADVVQLHA